MTVGGIRSQDFKQDSEHGNHNEDALLISEQKHCQKLVVKHWQLPARQGGKWGIGFQSEVAVIPVAEWPISCLQKVIITSFSASIEKSLLSPLLLLPDTSRLGSEPRCHSPRLPAAEKQSSNVSARASVEVRPAQHAIRCAMVVVAVVDEGCRARRRRVFVVEARHCSQHCLGPRDHDASALDWLEGIQHRLSVHAKRRPRRERIV